MKKKSKLSMILFTKDQLPEILKSLKIDMRKKHNCLTCEKRLNKNNIGNITKEGMYCDNPVCFSRHIAINRLW